MAFSTVPWGDHVRFCLDRLIAPLDPRPLATGCRLTLNFSVHTEQIFDVRIFERLHRFAAEVLEKTGARLLAAVMTPRCPLIAYRMKASQVSEAVFADRVKRLAAVAEVGLHGHYFREGAKLESWSMAGHQPIYNPEQFRAELGWLRDLGLKPKVYVGGWWFLCAELLADLEREEFWVDCSVRWDRRATFGEHFLKADEIPTMGERFTLGPARRLTEVQSLYMPLTHPRRHREKLTALFNGQFAQPPSVVLSFHDYDFAHYTRALQENLRVLTALGNLFTWKPVSQMRLS